MLAPIVLFIYNRVEHTKRTLEALEANTLAKDSELFIFADGPKKNSSTELLNEIERTREVAHSRQWCKNVTFYESEENKGLASSIINGVSQVVNSFGKVIVLEDDIVTGKFFLEYMNAALDKYETEQSVWHITGWRIPVECEDIKGSYFYPNMDCWGWATWKDRWSFYKRDVVFHEKLIPRSKRKAFNMDGVDPEKWRQIQANKKGTLNTWAIFWHATVFEHNGLYLAPKVTLVNNIGCDGSGEHCGENRFFVTKVDINHRIEDFPQEVIIDQAEYDRNKRYIKRMYSALRKENPFGFLRRYTPQFIKKIVKQILCKE